MINVSRYCTTIADAEVKELAQELADLLRKTVGTTKYTEAYAAVQQMVCACVCAYWVGGILYPYYARFWR